jgi:hypothetical protein
MNHLVSLLKFFKAFDLCFMGVICVILQLGSFLHVLFKEPKNEAGHVLRPIQAYAETLFGNKSKVQFGA